ncbi:MAG TPA: hypothetical protein VK816_11335 [Jatrophihabitantaceae bacterium]|jgi:hypothetical protein|nr:hypothetical protein [Jatrophihabitantaceae bacterium]
MTEPVQMSEPAGVTQPSGATGGSLRISGGTTPEQLAAVIVALSAHG